VVLICQRLNSGTNLRECEDQSWFKVQAVPKDVFVYTRLNTTGLKTAPSGTDGAVSKCLMTTQLTFPAVRPQSHIVISLKPRAGHSMGCPIDLGALPSLETLVSLRCSDHDLTD
jgi:hypothetical protein